MFNYYYINKKKSSKVAHLFSMYEEDTACKMLSSGGIKNREDYTVEYDLQGRKICGMCINNKKGKKGN